MRGFNAGTPNNDNQKTKAMKQPNDIAKLLQRFMAGESTLEEETRLSEYFLNEEVPEAWQPYKEMFQYFHSGMTEDVLKDRSTAAELSTDQSQKVNQPKPEDRSTKNARLAGGKWRLIVAPLLAAAAALLLFVLVPVNKQSLTQTAMLQTQKAHKTISQTEQEAQASSQAIRQKPQDGETNLNDERAAVSNKVAKQDKATAEKQPARQPKPIEKAQEADTRALVNQYLAQANRLIATELATAQSLAMVRQMDMDASLQASESSCSQAVALTGDIMSEAMTKEAVMLN